MAASPPRRMPPLMMMHVRRTGFQVGIGVLVLLLPLVGLPYAWEAVFQYFAGAAIVVLALPFSIAGTLRAMLRRPGTCPPEAAPTRDEASA